MITYDPAVVPLHIVLAIATVLYSISLAIYRLWFSPISHVPGPKLAAITLWYEFYYDCVLRGKYIFKIEELHKQYGPILRINPWEIHINDVEFFDEVYAISPNRKRDRWSWTVAAGGFTQTMSGAVDHDLHRLRKSAIAPFFAKANIRKLESRIDGRVKSLMATLQQRIDDAPFNVKHAFAALVNDILMECAFGHHVNRIEHKEYDPDFCQNFETGVYKINLLRHLPWLEQTARAIPPRFLAPFVPIIAQFWEEKIAITKQAKDVLESGVDGFRPSEHRTIYHDMLSSKLPPQEKNLDRLAQEAQILLGAGPLTSSWVLAVGCYHLLAPGNERYLAKLHTELLEAIPDTLEDGAFAVAKLEKLPYLKACMTEMTRLGNGLTTRLQRIPTQETLRYTSRKSGEVYPIPPGTPVSISGLLVHRNPEYFSDPGTFNPDRWIEDPSLSKYFVAFSAGSRACIGIHLSNALSSLSLARIFRGYVTPPLREKFRDSIIGCLELYETSVEDATVTSDLLVPAPHAETKGIRARVVS